MQRLRLRSSTAGSWVQSLAAELRSHTPREMAKIFFKKEEVVNVQRVTRLPKQIKGEKLTR